MKLLWGGLGCIEPSGDQLVALRTVLTRARTSPVVGQRDETISPEPFHSPSYTPQTSPEVGMSTADNIVAARVDNDREDPNDPNAARSLGTIMRCNQVQAGSLQTRRTLVRSLLGSNVARMLWTSGSPFGNHANPTWLTREIYFELWWSPVVLVLRCNSPTFGLD